LAMPVSGHVSAWSELLISFVINLLAVPNFGTRPALLPQWQTRAEVM
jgi:hypothetical protein